MTHSAVIIVQSEYAMRFLFNGHFIPVNVNKAKILHIAQHRAEIFSYHAQSVRLHFYLFSFIVIDIY